MVEKRKNYDWAQACFELASCESNKLDDMLSAARLDPLRGDISHIDLRGINLSGQDLRRWDMRYALFSKANVAGADLRGAKFDALELASAIGWRLAKLDEASLREVEVAAHRALMEKQVGEVLTDLAMSRGQSLCTEFLQGDRVPRPRALSRSAYEWAEFLQRHFSDPERNTAFWKTFRNYVVHGGDAFLETEEFMAWVRGRFMKHQSPFLALIPRKFYQVRMRKLVEMHPLKAATDTDSTLALAATIADNLPANCPVPRFIAGLVQSERLAEVLRRPSVLGLDLDRLRMLTRISKDVRRQERERSRDC